MKKNKVREIIHAPLSNKVLVLWHIYWRLKTQLYYRLMFRRIGPKTTIYSPMFLCNTDCIEIADRVSILSGIRLEAVRDPYGRTPLLTIGSNTGIEQGVHIVCHNRVKIGSNVSIAARSAIVDVTHPYQPAVGSGNPGARIADEDSFVEIGDGAFVGYGVVVLPNVRIGKYAVIGANSVVTTDIPDFSVAAGIPAKVIKTYSEGIKESIRAETGKQ